MEINRGGGLPSSESACVDEPGPCRPDHYAYDDAEYSDEKEIEETSPTLYRAGRTGVDDECLRLPLTIGSVKEDLFRSKAMVFNPECKRFSE